MFKKGILKENHFAMWQSVWSLKHTMRSIIDVKHSDRKWFKYIILSKCINQFDKIKFRGKCFSLISWSSMLPPSTFLSTLTLTV